MSHAKRPRGSTYMSRGLWDTGERTGKWVRWGRRAAHSRHGWTRGAGEQMNRGDYVRYAGDDHLWVVMGFAGGFVDIERHSGRGKQWYRQWVPVSEVRIPPIGVQRQGPTR